MGADEQALCNQKIHIPSYYLENCNELINILVSTKYKIRRKLYIFKYIDEWKTNFLILQTSFITTSQSTYKINCINYTYVVYFYMHYGTDAATFSCKIEKK